MRTALAFVRTLLFTVVFFAATVPWVVAALLSAPLSGRVVGAVATGWSYFHRLCSRWILGQKISIAGEIPHETAFYAMKHEAMFETLDMLCLFRRPVIAAKRELLDIPFWGAAARAYGVLSVDRSGGAAALRTLRKEARAVIDAGRPLCFFPEGTRVPHGQRPPIKPGFAGLYMLLGMPVIPVAVDSGRLNQRGRFIRYSGTIHYRFGEPIPPGLPRREAEARVHTAINSLNS
jgi:1-acyl-sn-glycerol-3-phosphate acyltransferase